MIDLFCSEQSKNSVLIKFLLTEIVENILTQLSEQRM